MSRTQSVANLPRLNNVQALRGLAAFMVMFSHLFIIEQKYSQDHILPSLFNFGMAGVDIFFVISGFIMVYVTHKWSGGSWRKIPEFLFARITRIYPLYWIVSAALLLVYIVRPEWVFASSAGNDPTLIKSFLLWPELAYPLLEVGWTLIHEMGFYLIFALILIASKRIRPLLIGLWAIIVISGNLMGLSAHSPFMGILFHPLSLEFCGGALLGYWLLKPNYIKGAMPLLIAAISAFFISLFAFAITGQNNPGFGWMRVGTFGVSALLILLAAYIFEQDGKTAPRWSVILGDWSYSLYLTHILTLSVIGRVWALFDQDGLWDNFIMLPLCLIGSIIVAGLTHKIIEAPMMRASKSIQDKLFKRA